MADGDTIFTQTKKNYESLSLTLDRISAVLINAIEFHDPYTKGHGERVSEIVQKLANALFPDIFTNTRELTLAAQLHDLGKLGISESVLNKPTFLTEAERQMIFAHPRIGAKLLEPLDLPKDNLLYAGVFFHHENFDGSGYPTGLAGQTIPLVARLIRVADFFEALTQRRAYREAYSTKDALISMERNCHYFDPTIFSYFLDHYRDLIQ